MVEAMLVGQGELIDDFAGGRVFDAGVSVTYSSPLTHRLIVIGFNFLPFIHEWRNNSVRQTIACP